MGTVVMSYSIFSRIIFVLLLVCAPLPASGDTVLIVGDSLSAGYGLPTGSGWVNLLSERLADDHPDVSVINASISGETTAGGKRRIQALLERHQPVVVVVELGANDGLRGIRIPLITEDLAAIVTASRRFGARTLVLGMRIPPNYGRDYAEKFHAMFKEVSNRHGASLVPFMLEGFADNRALFQDDGIHPTIEAQPLILDNIYGALQRLLKD